MRCYTFGPGTRIASLLRTPSHATLPMTSWSPAESARLYHVAEWGDEYFHVGENGNVEVTPEGPGNGSIDLFELVGQI
ncbi:MAG: arginine decarboxylase-like protein, partial [Planctomycetota bacterium]